MNDDKQFLLLVADDNKSNLKLLTSILHENNYRIAIALTGVKVLEFVEKEIPDLILLDIMMPEMDGYEVCKRLKSNDKTKDIPILFLTAKVETDDIVLGFNLGGADYVLKPFKKEELLVRIRTQLELSESRKLILKLNNMKDRLFSIISHDLKSSLGLSMNFFQLLTEKNPDLMELDREELLLQLKDESQKTYNLLENLLFWARDQQNLQEIKIETLNLNGIINEIYNLFSNKAKNKNVNLITNIAEDIFIDCDREMINIVFRNLVSNALKFTKSGDKITISAIAKTDTVQIEISDTGVGISPENLDKMFRLDQFMTTKGTLGEAGTGLGLSLCKEFIKKNNGKIEVQSEINIGTKFLIHLPKSNLNSK